MKVLNKIWSWFIKKEDGLKFIITLFLIVLFIAIIKILF